MKINPNPWNTPVGRFAFEGGKEGAKELVQKNRGCRKVYDVGGMLLGILFIIIGINGLSSSPLGAFVCLILGVLFLALFIKDFKR